MKHRARRLTARRLQTLAWSLLLAATLTAMTAATATAWLDSAGKRRDARRAEDLQCLAENVYYEARGEPLVGQYAVAEVTMNRVRSRDFPNSVCAVVHARGAFSWTLTGDVRPPYGYEWRRARAVAGTVYDSQEAPFVAGALYYHATYVAPDWAPTRSQVAHIGKHLFYL